MRFSKRCVIASATALMVLPVLGRQPAYACSECDQKLSLVPAHLACIERQLGDLIEETQTIDPILIIFAQCGESGSTKSDYDSKGPTEPVVPKPVVPDGSSRKAKGADASSPSDESGDPSLTETATLQLPEGYKRFVRLSHEQLRCLQDDLTDVFKDKSTIIKIDLSNC